jgi:hypothetical protein
MVQILTSFTILVVLLNLNEAQINYHLAERELFPSIFSCDKFRSYISDDSKVKVHTDYCSFNEISGRTDVKPRMTIRWILLLKEFELQIIQRKEDKTTPLDHAVAPAVCIPLGTIEDKEEKGCCKSIGDVLRKIMCIQRKKVPRRLEEINLLP